MPWWFSVAIGLWVLTAIGLLLETLRRVAARWFDNHHHRQRVLRSRWLFHIFLRRDAELDAVVTWVREQGERQGFPRVPLHGFMVRRWVGASYRQANVTLPNGCILVWPLRPRAGLQVSREDLQKLIGHEYGHMVQLFGRPGDHPLLDRIRHLEMEDFADAVAEFICGAGAVERLTARCSLQWTAFSRGRVELTNPPRFR